MGRMASGWMAVGAFGLGMAVMAASMPAPVPAPEAPAFLPPPTPFVQAEIERPADRAARVLGRMARDLDTLFHRELTEADVAAMVGGALAAIDEHGSYVPAESMRALQGTPTEEERAQQPYRVGVLGNAEGARFVVETTAPGGPADRAGLRGGDALLSVAGEDMRALDGKQAYERLVAAVEASEGRAVELVVERAGVRLTLSLTPERLPPVFAYDLGIKDGVLHTALVAFYPGATDELRAIIERGVEQGIEGVAIDVRGNVGGRVDEAMAVAGLFLPEGSLVFTSTARGQQPEESRTAAPPTFPDLRLAVLTNIESASSSEIFAAAIQAHARGVVVGGPTYGKGSIQTVYGIDPMGGAIKFTVGFYRDPFGRRIDGIGVLPTITVPSLIGGARPPVGTPDPVWEAAEAWIEGGDAPPVPVPPAPMDRPLLGPF